MIDNETAERITKFSKNLEQNSPETVTNDNGKKTPKDRWIFPENRQTNYWWSEINIIV